MTEIRTTGMVKKTFMIALTLLLCLPNLVFAQGDELEQRYADGELAFDYPAGWLLHQTGGGISVFSLNAQAVTDIGGDEPDFAMVSFLKLTDTTEEISWPLDADLVFLAGYVTNEVVSGWTEEGEQVEFGQMERSTINGDETVLMTFQGEEMAGIVVLLEGNGKRLIVSGMTTAQTFGKWENTMRLIIQSVRFNN
jgi:hypothetical protein